jgi:uncharacterized protein
MKNTIVIYHKNCPDGMSSATIAYKKFGEKAEYIACSDRINPPEYLTNHTDKKNTKVFILDFSYPSETLKKIQNDFEDIVVLDHHMSAKEDTISIKNGYFDNSKCGASMTYDYFFGENNESNFVKIIEIIDLHKDDNHDMDDIIAYINSVPYTLQDYSELINNYDQKYLEYSEKGKAINRYVSLLESMATDDFDIVEFEGYRIPAVNMTFDINTKSRILAKLYEIMPPFSMGYRYHGGEWKVSLRSDKTFDVSKLAAKYGGGGHAGSSGFAIKAESPTSFMKFIPKES